MEFMLTGKAKIDFEDWLNKNHNKEVVLTTCSGDYEGGCFEYDKTVADLVLDYDKIPYLLEGLVIDFFDTVDIYVNTLRYNKTYFQSLCNHLLHEKYETRSEALKQAIIHANKIYNEERV